MLTDPSRKGDDLDRDCPKHKLKGALYCVTCSVFVCKDCIKEGTHSGCEICDIDERPELKEKIKDLSKFKTTVFGVAEDFTSYKKDFKTYYDISEEELTWICDRYKQKLTSTVDQFLEEKLATIRAAEKKYEDMCQDADLLEKAQKTIFEEESKDLAVDEVKSEFIKYLHKNGSGAMVKILKEGRSNLTLSEFDSYKP